MRRIAISGMKGRKKDTFLLSFVIGLAFVFIILATIFHASSEGTKIEQRTAMFGSWDATYLKGSKEVIEDLKKKEEVEKLGMSRLLGYSTRFGIVGTINEDLLDLGEFTMYEGRMPENENEIALELSQLSNFPTEVNIGDKIPVEVIIEVYNRPWEEAAKEQMRRIIPEIEDKLGYRDILYQMNNYDIWAREFQEKYDRWDITGKENYPMNWFSYLYWQFSKSYTRNEQSLESFDNTKVITKTSYVQTRLMDMDDYWERMNHWVPPEERIDTEPIEAPEQAEIDPKELSMISQNAHITREMVVTGIIQNYSNLWDTGDEPLANAFVTEEAGRNFLEKGFLLTEEIDVSEYEAPVNIFIGSNISSADFTNQYEEEFEGLRRNTYAYPDIGGSTESTLTYGILAAIFIATIFAVFQIYLTQTKRRTRRIALLKSIGAVNGQIRSVLVWEAIYLLLFTLPIGIGLGLALSKLALILMNRYGNTILNLHIDYGLSLLGIGLGIMAVFIGMIVPMIMSMKVPLTGSISKPVRKKAIKGKLKAKAINLNMKVQSFRKISIKNIKYNKGKTLLTTSLYTITTAVLLGTIFLSFIFFGEYIDDVVIQDKPAYGIEINHALTNRSIPEFMDSIYDIEGISRVELYKAGEHAYLWHENIGKNEIYPVFKELLPHKLINEHFGVNDLGYVNLDDDNMHLVKDAVVSNIYGIDVEDPIYKRFEDSLTEGKLNKEKFKTGEEVILLLPIYHKRNLDGKSEISDEIISGTSQKDRIEKLLRNGDKFNLSYDFRHASSYLKDESIAIGDKIHLTIPTENIVDQARTNDVRFVETRVAGIIHYFPEKAIWPFGENVENPVVIGGYNFLGKTHSSTITGIGGLPDYYLDYLIESLYPTKYGKTHVYIYEDKKADEIQVDVNLKRVARENSVRLRNYNEENKKAFNKAFNMAAIISILGISVAIITLIILYNTTLSKLEQERERIGTFQALGVTSGQFRGLYILSGIGYGLIALAISHLLLALAVLFTFMAGRPNPLYLYPWKIHILTSIGLFIIISLTYYMPLRKIIKNQPIDNIRNLGR